MSDKTLDPGAPIYSQYRLPALRAPLAAAVYRWPKK